MAKNAVSKLNTGKVFKLNFRHVYYTAVTADATWTVDNVPLEPSQLGDRVNQVGLQHEFYRVVDLKVKTILPLGGYTYIPADQASQMCAVGYTPEPNYSTAPGGFDSMSQMDYFDMANGYSEGAEIHVNRKSLLGNQPLKWWKTYSDSVGTIDQLDQGRIWIGNWTDYTGSATFRLWTMITGSIEFTGAFENSIALSRNDEESHKAQKAALAARAADCDSVFIAPDFKERIPPPPGISLTRVPSRRIV
jgi:hypothetical protein